MLRPRENRVRPLYLNHSSLGAIEVPMQNAVSIDGQNCRSANETLSRQIALKMPVRSGMSKASRIRRREFLGRAAATIAAPLCLSAGTLGLSGCRRPGANERVTVGLIGLGGQGFDNLRQFLRLADVQVVAVCDVEPLHYRDNPWKEGPAYGREPAQAHVEGHYAEQQKSGTYSGCAALVDFRVVRPA